jgi:hypothetical protein
MRTRYSRASVTFAMAVLAGSIAGCERGGSELPAEVTRAREQAARRSCVAEAMLRRASADVADLQDAVQGSSGDTPGAELTRRAGVAALQFARAYQQHAELLAAGYAHVDSALSYSRRAADSVQHAQMAQRLSIRRPEPGTIEANVIAAYDRDFASLLNDADHPCNWEPLER